MDVSHPTSMHVRLRPAFVRCAITLARLQTIGFGKIPIELLDIIFKQCSIPDLNHCTESCKSLYILVHHYLEDRINAHRVLDRFFDHQQSAKFQELQARTGLAISGLAVFKLITFLDYKSDLDTYCALANCLEVGSWYLDSGYSFRPRANQLASFHDNFKRASNMDSCRSSPHVVNENGDGTGLDVYQLKNIVEVWDFVRLDAYGEEWIVQLISARKSVLEAILLFHSTCVMNIMTHNAVYVLFADLMLNKQKTMVFNGSSPLSERDANVIRKYERLGWDSFRFPTIKQSLSDRTAVSFTKWRSVGDHHMAVFNIAFNGDKEKNTAPVIESNSFSIDYTGPRTTLSYSCLVDDLTKHEYIIAPAQLAFVKKRLANIRRLRGSRFIDPDVAILAIQEFD
ncbi:hypothetical protein GYMLUDRAFT_250577 [Collybiopsis luxurians FD-317 M1]|uniref:Unplaced genomic scaffold GYMLUscaffold_84, whole genome shotgun sequence n=1 Tax=Collybiopsis luxurians FD-317 M1 TaxID=944289 RepID=A0A0D0CDV4_9AGAR|nr:hypothetical protein GYMLUDRAFT_250577 [Collybiopsis luxurians FD-317 M1]